MKVKELIKKLYGKCVAKDVEGEKATWLKLLRKSLKHKNTTAVK
jgi:hypothetical protein